MTTLKIKVTKEIIEKAKWCGIPGTLAPVSENCAVALAVRDIWPKAAVGKFWISPFGIHGEPTESLDSIYLPPQAALFIQKFDQADLTTEQLIALKNTGAGLARFMEYRRSLPEIEFTVEVPDSVIDQIDISSLIDHPTLEIV